MRSYTQLSQEERYYIGTMSRKGYSLRAIAADIGRNHTTVSRELQRNTGQRGYRYQQAHSKAAVRHTHKTKAKKLTGALIDYIEQGLRNRWSPEQICGRLYREKKIKLSHETVYRYVSQDKRSGGNVYTFLRHKAKPYRKRYGSKDYRGTLPDRVDISERPEVVDKRSRVGDWEADLMIGKGHKGAIVTLAERRSRLYLALPIMRKTAELTTTAITTLLTGFKDWVHTITYDNGREFVGHKAMAKALSCDTFFARPYHSWERGLNENSNGLLRQYFPKDKRLDDVPEEAVLVATEAMNHRPRKCLGFKTPWEVFAELTQTNTQLETSGALMS